MDKVELWTCDFTIRTRVHGMWCNVALGTWRVIKIEWSSFNLFKLNEMHWIITDRSYFCV